MSSLQQILSNIETFLSKKIDETELPRLMDELSASVADLVKHPLLPIRKRLVSLFARSNIDDSLSKNLVTSLITAIRNAREKQFEISTEPIETLFFPLLRSNSEIVIAKAMETIPDIKLFPPNKILELIEDAAISFAQLLGSNVADSLAVKDPAGVFNSKTLVLKILQGDNLDPIQIANLFTTLSGVQRQELIRLIGDKVTQAQQMYQSRKENLLRSRKMSQWIYDKLREHFIPHQVAIEIIPVIIQEYTVEELENMSSKQFRKLIFEAISVVS